MRTLARIILHCTATKADQDITIDDVRKWHTDPKDKGGRAWSDVGYHYLITLDGTIQAGRPLHKQGAHTRGENADSIGIAYAGGLDSEGAACNTMNADQRRAFKALARALRVIICNPLTIHWHCEYSDKSCPNFNVADYFSRLMHEVSNGTQEGGS